MKDERKVRGLIKIIFKEEIVVYIFSLYYFFIIYFRYFIINFIWNFKIIGECGFFLYMLVL